MLLFYRTGIFIYTLIIRFAALFNRKARLFIQGRKNIFETLKRQNPDRLPHIWFHFASLGEFEQGKPVLEKIKTQHPETRIAISFFSPSGYEIIKNYAMADIICYLPMDNADNARQFIHLIRPTQAYFTKYEFWHYYFQELNKNHIPLYLISGIFRANQLFFKPYGGFYRKMLQNVSYFFVQNQESINLLHQIHLDNACLCGDTRFDTVWTKTMEVKPIPAVEKFINGQFCIVAGSTWPADEKLLLHEIVIHPQQKWIIAPHQIDAAHLQSLMQLLAGIATVKYSELHRHPSAADAQVLIIDNIGLLSSLYQYAQISYIGGGFGAGIHNTLEAVAFGSPVIFGPKYQKFEEAKQLLQQHIAISIAHENELAAAFIQHKNQLKNIQPLAKQFIQKRIGAAEKIVAQTKRSGEFYS